MYRRAVVLALVTMSGCTLTGNSTKTSVFIDDGRTSNGFSIATVDGKPPIRWSHPIATVVPVVLVEPGKHTFTIEGSGQSFTAEVQEGRKYRTDSQNGSPTLIISD